MPLPRRLKAGSVMTDVPERIEVQARWVCGEYQCRVYAPTRPTEDKFLDEPVIEEPTVFLRADLASTWQPMETAYTPTWEEHDGSAKEVLGTWDGEVDIMHWSTSPGQDGGEWLAGRDPHEYPVNPTNWMPLPDPLGGES